MTRTSRHNSVAISSGLEVTARYRRIISELDIKVPMEDPAKYIRVVNNLNFDESPERKAIEIVKQAGKRNILLGKDPRHGSHYTLPCNPCRGPKGVKDTARNSESGTSYRSHHQE